MYFTGFHLFTYQKIYFDTLFVGVAGFEPAASTSQTWRDNRATFGTWRPQVRILPPRQKGYQNKFFDT